MIKQIFQKAGPRENLAVMLTAILLVLVFNSCDTAVNKPLLALQPLPYAETALEPYMSAETLKYHYGKHYAGYVDSANRLARQAGIRGKSPVEIIQQTSGEAANAVVFNQVSQAWNHAFFWKSLKPGGGGQPQGPLAQKIIEAFGSFGNFKAEFISAAGDLFGSGWVWLAMDGDDLIIVPTADADTPVAHGLHPLLVVDVWEHAYYLDYRNRRIEFVETVLSHLANWDFAAMQLERHAPEHQ